MDRCDNQEKTFIHRAQLGQRSFHVSKFNARSYYCRLKWRFSLLGALEIPLEKKNAAAAASCAVTHTPVVRTQTWMSITQMMMIILKKQCSSLRVMCSHLYASCEKTIVNVETEMMMIIMMRGRRKMLMITEMIMVTRDDYEHDGL